MATAPRQASSESTSLPPEIPIPSENESDETTVEEGPGGLELIALLRQAVDDGSEPTDAILRAIAEAGRILSNADGIALALRAKGMFVCRARSGEIAPELGAPMNAQSGISGECLRSATMLVCHDALTDPRVDTEVCSALGIRSVVAVPIHGHSRLGGLFEAFSSRPNAFDGDALSSLRALGEIAGSAYRRDEPLPPRATFRTITAVESPRTMVPPALLTSEFLAIPGPTWGRFWIASAVGITLLLMVAVAWWSWNAPGDEIVREQQAHSAASPDIHGANAQAVITTPKPGPGIVSRRSDRQPDHTLILNAVDVEPVYVSPAPAFSSESENISRSTTRKNDSEEMAAEAPQVELAPPANPEALAQLSSVQAQMPVVGPVVSEGVVQPTLVHKVAPGYPMLARNERVSGRVVLSATIGSDGKISGVTVVSGAPVLAQAAEAALRQWRYRPAELSGKPITNQKEITFLFTLP